MSSPYENRKRSERPFDEPEKTNHKVTKSKELNSLESLLQKSLAVIPEKAGIQSFQDVLDPSACSGLRSGVRRGDGFVEFCRSLLIQPLIKTTLELRQEFLQSVYLCQDQFVSILVFAQLPGSERGWSPMDPLCGGDISCEQFIPRPEPP